MRLAIEEHEAGHAAFGAVVTGIVAMACAAGLTESAFASTTPMARGGERVVGSTSLVTASPGSMAPILLLLESSTTPLFGYSLNIDVAPLPGSHGAVTANVALTNFFEARNLITAGGATLDSLFSVISDPGDGGVFLSANTADLSTVTATPGVNDALAQIVFDISPDATGSFLITLGPGSALSDGAGFPVPFSFSDITINVTGAMVPLPTSFGLAMAAGAPLVIARHRRRLLRHGLERAKAHH